MAKFFGPQGRPVSTSGGQSVPSAAVPPVPAAAGPQGSSQSDKREQTPAKTDSGAGTLVIGPQIVLSGEVTSCTRLVVEGTIKANIKECRDIAIAQGGLFSGSAAVQSADISGRFEGDLKVSGRLLIRAPGLVSGTVQYRELEIERGGRIAGNVSSTGGSGNGGKP